MHSIPSSFHPLPTFHTFTLSDYTASRRVDHQGQDRNKDQDILSNLTRFCCRDNPPTPPTPPQQHAHRLHLPGKQTRTQSQTVDQIHTRAISGRDLAASPLQTQTYASARIQGRAAASRCKEATCYSRKNRHVSTSTLTRSHTAVMGKKSTGRVEEEEEGDALPFLPLVLHPTLSSFPS